MTGLGKWRDILKTTNVYKVWQMIYPVGIYYVVSGLVYFGLEAVMGPAGSDYMLRQMICAAATLPFLWTFYKEDRRAEQLPKGGVGRSRDVIPDPEATFHRKRLLSSLALSAIAGGTAGIALNNLIAMARLTQVSAGFQEANEAFFAGKLIYELLGSCLLIPAAEELLYRGVVYKRMRAVFGVRLAIILSALLFGLMHGNLVQFLYAGLLGLLLAYLLERTGSVWAPVLAHIAANLAAVARQETGWLSFCYEASPGAVLCTAGLAVAAAAATAAAVRISGYGGGEG